LTLREVKELLEADVIVGENLLDMEVKSAFGADLLSDVLAFAESGSILLTGLTNNHVIRIANILDITAIILVRSKRLPDETVKMAEDFKIPVLSTKYILFEAAGRLYAKGIVGCPEKVNNNLIKEQI
jgi:predicted transcriptional regulator